MRVQADHWAAFLDFAEKNPSVITNKFIGPKGKEELDALWVEITTILNSLGFGQKTVNEWKKTIIDWKSKTKAKAAGITKDMLKTGGGPSSGACLSSFEERLLNIMGRTSAFGDARIEERGLKRRNELDIPHIHSLPNKKSEFVPSTATAIVNNSAAHDSSTSMNVCNETPVHTATQLTPVHVPVPTAHIQAHADSKERLLLRNTLQTCTEDGLHTANISHNGRSKTSRQSDILQSRNQNKSEATQVQSVTIKRKTGKENIAPITEAKDAFINMHEEVVEVLNSININLLSLSNSLQDIANCMKKL